MRTKQMTAAGLALVTGAALAQVDQRTEYNRRVAARDVALFGQLDRNADGRLTRDEVKGDNDLGPRFDDIDINRDGVITQEELTRFIDANFR